LADFKDPEHEAGKRSPQGALAPCCSYPILTHVNESTALGRGLEACTFSKHPTYFQKVAKVYNHTLRLTAGKEVKDKA
jgi:hypothetical protein